MYDQAQVPPALMLRHMRASRALHAAAHFGIADILAHGPMGSRELAATAGTDAQTLRPLRRAVVALGVFEEEALDRFCLNPAAELSQRAGVLFTAGDIPWQLW
jgi:hypothetical protein